MMKALQGLPDRVADLLSRPRHAQFATVSREGAPIDTPLLVFPADDLSVFNGGTGLAYPVKAERARRNPKVGLLFEGGPDEPVVSVAGLAAVRDADIQTNTLRYISAGTYGATQPWEIARQAVWYWARILMQVTPRRILWWDRPATMDEPAHLWEAPADAVYPVSDPAPAGPPSAPSAWPQAADWRDVVRPFLDQGAPGHLTLIDAEGFPRPIGARSVRLTEAGFELDMPHATPWAAPGLGCLTFGGRATFIGSATGRDTSWRLAVQRMLPVNPLVIDARQVLQPSPEVKAALMTRLEAELARRGQAMPVIPETQPEPTASGRRRHAQIGPRLRR
jgi:hypothetical protein